ncbi:hypothetical protein B7R22_16985 [Subtercola boreus]|uniref:Replication terminator protein n=1 Tax=Subtercola boreus TaxID=120213 RepID=A0A3E0VQG0_9MICO|nr:hypothetical protein [Subtercola boreus]RFA12126.1 hypothetical protein B7R22_16985 [Subtercola boreus]
MASDRAAQKELEPGSFAAFLAQQRPKTDVELHEELRKLVAAVRDTGKAGTISLKITVKPLDDSGSALSINDEITVKRPERNRDNSIAYVDSFNNLHRRDPSSMPLFEDESDIRTAADPATGEIRDIN